MKNTLAWIHTSGYDCITLTAPNGKLIGFHFADAAVIKDMLKIGVSNTDDWQPNYPDHDAPEGNDAILVYAIDPNEGGHVMPSQRLFRDRLAFYGIKY